MNLHAVVTLSLISIGVFTFWMDALGFYRFDNVLMRMHAATKGSTLGIGFVLLGVMVYFGEFTLMLKLVALIFFLFITAPVGAQAIARAAYSADEVYNDLRESLVIDELAEHYPDRR
ncbi:MAG: monovalent cation/H(+) antiporter subunit G, partial [Chloroflexi bacterium]|nr:monovalent cation/H(+) antiporter subunit G [Chloroflexota bacterium]